MPKLCIPPKVAEKLKIAAQEGAIKIDELYNMTSKDRRSFFTRKTGDENLGRLLNSEFESAMISGQKDAMASWAKKVFVPKRMGETLEASLSEIKKLESTIGDKSDDFLEDLVYQRLGISLSEKELKEIITQADKITAALEKFEDIGEIGSLKKQSETLDFFKRKKEMNELLDRINPETNMETFFGKIAKGTLLAGIKSTVTNIIGNIGNFVDLVAKSPMVGLKTTNNSKAWEYIKHVNRIYKETGFDISRMREDGSALKVLGEEFRSAQGKGFIKKIGRFYDNVIYHKLLGIPDVATSSFMFADTVNRYSNRLARQELKGGSPEQIQKLAEDLMEDSMRLKPETIKGEQIRKLAIDDAEYGTFTNDTALARASLKARDLLNSLPIIGTELRFGDLMAPFVKVPANVIQKGVDYSPLGSFKALLKLKNAALERSPELAREAAVEASKVGLGGLGALFVVENLKPTDFMGAYDPQRAEIAELKGSTFNAIKIGNKWISMDYFGVLAPTITAYMYKKKYGEDAKFLSMVSALGAQVGRAPGFEEVADIVGAVSETNFQNEKSVDDFKDKVVKIVADAASSRTIPMILSDIAKATDYAERQTTFKGQTIGERTKAKFQEKIPFYRQGLPEKVTVFADIVETQNPITQLFFGARVKDASEDPLNIEITRLADSGNKVSITNLSFPRSDRVKRLTDGKSPQEVTELKKEYGTILRKAFERETTARRYQTLSDEDKKKELDKLENTVIDKFLNKKGIKRKK